MSKRKRMIPTRRKTPLGRGLELLHAHEFWKRIGVCLASAFLIWLMTRGWEPPFSYRLGDVPRRDVYARVDFSVNDFAATEDKRSSARRNAFCFYENSPRELEELREILADRLFRVTSAEDFDSVDLAIVDEFIARAEGEDSIDESKRRETYDSIKQSMIEDTDGSKVYRAVEHALLDHIRHGLLVVLEHEPESGSNQTIMVYTNGDHHSAVPVDVSSVRIGEVIDLIEEKLSLEMHKEFEEEQAADAVAELVFNWLEVKLPITLDWNESLSQQAQEQAARNVPIEKKFYSAGQRLEPRRLEEVTERGIDAGRALTAADLSLLREEHRAFLSQRSLGDILSFIGASFGMYAAVFTLCGFYLYYRDPTLINEIKQLIAVVATASLTVCLMWMLNIRFELWQGELIPLVMFTMTIAIAYRQELAFFLMAIVSFVATMTSGQGISEFVIMIATSAAAALLSGSIRSRTRLVYVGIIAAVVGFPTSIGVHILDGDPMGPSLFIRASWVGMSAIIAGLLMTAVLPFLERSLGLETDISLLEIGDAAHPLLQELVRRAPGTYNHSINVASIAEAAAESIGANGLLCRVAAYFHDVGKMLKPEYFIENQNEHENKHESLNPAMSTLVITAHVKDGVELAKEHHLPNRIIDLIEQHHGTTLVEYFYLRATRMCEEESLCTSVDESSYRYPGPKPQTREAAVMMLSDAVESASRTLVDPAPARITSLVQEISRKRLDDGQFDECNLTLRHIKLIEESLIKSLTAVYHGRVKYPDQQTA